MSRTRRAGMQLCGRWAACLAALLIGEAALGQSIKIPGHQSEAPIYIDADGGLEWHSKSRIYVARDNARASQGDFAIRANVLTAHYRKGEQGETEIWQIEAVGDVILNAATLSATGSKGTYEVATQVLTLKGPVRLETDNGVITARERLVFRQKEWRATVTGRAIAKRGNEHVSARKLVAYIKTNSEGETVVRQVDAFDNVEVTTPNEVVTSRRGTYDAESGVVRLDGDVKLTKGESQMNGDNAVVNLRTGSSRLGTKGGDGVRGKIVRSGRNVRKKQR